jgi:hypothetical protein
MSAQVPPDSGIDRIEYYHHRLAYSEHVGDAFSALTDEAGGVLALYVISPTALPSLLRAALAGDVRAAQLRPAVLMLIDKVKQLPRHSPMACGGCPRPVKLRGAYRLGIVLSDIERPSRGIGFVLCRYCCGTDAAVAEAAIRAVRYTYPSARPIVISHPQGGHA